MILYGGLLDVFANMIQPRDKNVVIRALNLPLRDPYNSYSHVQFFFAACPIFLHYMYRTAAGEVRRCARHSAQLPVVRHSAKVSTVLVLYTDNRAAVAARM